MSYMIHKADLKCIAKDGGKTTYEWLKSLVKAGPDPYKFFELNFKLAWKLNWLVWKSFFLTLKKLMGILRLV